MRRSVLAVAAGVTVLAAALAWTRVPFRWTQVALAYMAYFREYAQAVEVNGPSGLLSFVGLHPPAYSLVALGLMEAEASGRVWMAVSAAFGALAAGATALAAARLVPRAPVVAALVAGTLLATWPHRVAYGLEPNNYPLLTLAVALQAWAFVAWTSAPDRRRDALLMAATTLGLWTHALFVTVPVGQALGLLGTGRARRMAGVTAVAAALCLPLVPGVLAVGGSVVNPGGGPLVVLGALLDGVTRYGPGGALALGVGALAGLGAWSGRDEPGVRGLLAQGLLGLGLVALSIARGTAAAHQFPYLLLFGTPTALLAARAAADRRAVAVGASLLLACTGGAWGISEGARGRDAWDRAAVTHPMAARARSAWGPDTSLLLLGFPEGGDDDKDVLEPAMRFVPRAEPLLWEDPDIPGLTPADPYWGQPVALSGGRWLYTFTGFDPERATVIADTLRSRGEPLVVLVSEIDRAPHEVERVVVWAEARGARVLRGLRGVLILLDATGPR